MALFNKTDKGNAGEKIAAGFLKRKGYKIIETQYKTKTGEIDIIANKGNTLVFIEVKLRAGTSFGGAVGAVNACKQNKMTSSAVFYIKSKKISPENIRFDVVAVTENKEPQHIENAFTPRRYAV